jgi:hypothetical protein
LALWNAVQREYAVDDVGGVETLMQCCLMADRAEALAGQITRDGEVIRSKSGLRSHPAIRDEIACRSFIVRGLARLGVTLEPLKSAGRPSGGLGITLDALDD